MHEVVDLEWTHERFSVRKYNILLIIEWGLRNIPVCLKKILFARLSLYFAFSWQFKFNAIKVKDTAGPFIFIKAFKRDLSDLGQVAVGPSSALLSALSQPPAWRTKSGQVNPQDPRIMATVNSSECVSCHYNFKQSEWLRFLSSLVYTLFTCLLGGGSIPLEILEGRQLMALCGAMECAFRSWLCQLSCM